MRSGAGPASRVSMRPWCPGTAGSATDDRPQRAQDGRRSRGHPVRNADQPGCAQPARGPAAATSGETRSANRSKFSANMPASVRAWASYASRVRPGGARREDLGRHARHAHRHLDTEHRVGDRGHTLECAVERGPDHVAGLLDVHPLADAERAPGPARVDQPDGHIVRVEPLAQHRRVDRGVAGHEGRPEAGRERRRGRQRHPPRCQRAWRCSR